jgi:Domain of unknown function (DUF5666)
MSPDFPAPPPPPPPALPASRRAGWMRLLGIGLTIAAVGAGTGFIVTRAASTTAANATAASTTARPEPAKHKPSFGSHGTKGLECGDPLAGAGFDGPSSFRGFCGGETGTVTKISGSTLTLRTLAGTVTVTTTASTTYSREEQQVHFSAVIVGDVVAVRGNGNGTSPTATSPIAATEITIEVPSVAGRVQSVSGGIVTLVTGDGQLEHVTISSSTVYHGAGGAAATSSSVKVGVFIVAQGMQVNLTTLNADDVQVLETSGAAPHGFPGDSGAAPEPPEPSDATDST